MESVLIQLRSEVAAGRMSRHGLLEEIERHLDRDEGPIEGALEIVAEELRRSPGDAHARRLLARLYERIGQAEAARGALAPDEAVGTSVEDRLVLARVLLEAKELAEAERVVLDALEQEPTSLSALNLLAKICHVAGRLTDAVHLWRRIHLLAPSREGALAELGLIHRLAAGESPPDRFVAIGQDTYLRKHPAQVELEAAFARFKSRDFTGALQICESVASQWKDAPPIYKLAVLQKAWFQERTDDLDGARATLVQLGRERGYETDVDRLSLLARVCERIGSPEAVRQAIHIYEHLNVHCGKLSALPRLAALWRAAGSPERGERYAREFERRFARRMHKPSPADIVRALSFWHVGLDRVPQRAPAEHERAAVAREIRLATSLATRRRRRAVLAWLSGDRARCRRLFDRLTRSRLAAPRDFAYLGDVLTAERRFDEAHRAYVEALRRDPSARDAPWVRALEGIRRGVDRSPLARVLTDADAAEHARAAVLTRARTRRIDPEAWRTAAALERLLDGPDKADAYEAKAAALERARRERADVGRVRVAAVYTLNGKPKGLIHELVATRRYLGPHRGGTLGPDGLLGSVAADLRPLAATVLASTIDFVRTHWPHLSADADGYEYAVKFAKDDEPSSGASAGLPLAMAYLSLVLGREVPSDVAFTGAVVCDSRGEMALRPVGDASVKVKGAFHCDLRAIVLPEENRRDVELGDVVPPSISRALVRYCRSLDDVVEAVWGRSAWDW